MLTKLELYGQDGQSGFCTQRYYFEDGVLVEEGCRLPDYGDRSTRYFEWLGGVDDMEDGAKYHWGP